MQRGDVNVRGLVSACGMKVAMQLGTEHTQISKKGRGSEEVDEEGFGGRAPLGFWGS